MTIAQALVFIFIGLFLGFCLGLWEKNSYQPKHLDKHYPVPSGPYEIQPPNKPRDYRGGQILSNPASQSRRGSDRN